MDADSGDLENLNDWNLQVTGEGDSEAVPDNGSSLGLLGPSLGTLLGWSLNDRAQLSCIAYSVFDRYCKFTLVELLGRGHQLHPVGSDGNCQIGVEDHQHIVARCRKAFANGVALAFANR